MNVIELLARDKPKKVRRVKCTAGDSWGECPECEKTLFLYGKDVEMNFCHYCGQRLIWWERNEE